MWPALYLIFLQATGYAIVRPLASRRSRLEIAGLSACLGPGVFGLCLIFLSMLGLRPNRTEVLILGFISLIAAAISFRKPRQNDPADHPEVPQRFSRLWTAACLAAIAYATLVIAADVTIYPTMEWDAFGIWQLKAEVLATSALEPRPAYFENLNLSYSHLRYPLLAPMISTGIHALTGQLRDDGQKAPAPLMYLGLVAIIYSTIRRGNGHLVAITIITIFADLPVFFRYAGSGTAEMALTAFYGASIICLLRWWKQRHWGDLILAALFTAFMAWTKNEGQALAAINALIVACLILPRRLWAQGATFIAIVFFLFLPWLIYIRNLPQTDENYAARLNPREFVAHIDRVPNIVRGIASALAKWTDTSPQRLTAAWGIFWLLLAIIAIARWRQFQRRDVALLWLLLLLHLLAYIPPYAVTPWDLQSLMSTTIDRLLMHAAPIAALLMGAMWETVDQSRRPALT